MDDLIQAIKSNDLVAVRKVFESLMAPEITSLIEARKIEIARSVMIEGEEPEDEDDDEDVKKKKNKEESDDEADEGDEDEDEDEDDE